MLRLLGVIFLLIGLFLCLTIIGWVIGVWFLLFGVLLLIFGGRRVVEVHHHHDDYEPPRRSEKVIGPKVIEAPPAPARKLRADAADDFTSAVLLYQRHAGFADPGDAIRHSPRMRSGAKASCGDQVATLRSTRTFAG